MKKRSHKNKPRIIVTERIRTLSDKWDWAFDEMKEIADAMTAHARDAVARAKVRWRKKNP